MGKQSDYVTGPVLGSKRVAPAFNLLSAATLLVEAGRECYVTHQVEKSRQTRLATFEATRVEEIRQTAAAIERYLDETFKERRHVIDGMFLRLDEALKTGNDAAFAQAVAGIVDVAKESPLAGAEFEQLASAFQNKNVTWEL